MFLVINLFSDNVLAGEILKVMAPDFYKKDQQNQRLNWFNRLAKEEGESLHVAAGWNYLTEDQFNGRYAQFKKNSQFEFHALIKRELATIP